MMNDHLKQYRFTFSTIVLSEKELIPAADYRIFRDRIGWLRQQIIKMAIATRVKTEFYICLDADVICIKPVTFYCLVRGGRPGINLEPKAWDRIWWNASGKVLRLPDPGTEYGMSSSTNIFITQEVISLISFIEETYGKSWIRTLLNWFWTNTYWFKREWTEYKLYWLYIEFVKKADSYDPGNKIWGKSIWKCTKEINERLFMEIMDPRQEGYFTICQSSRVPDDVIIGYANKYLGI
jgi:hypothetical protein